MTDAPTTSAVRPRGHFEQIKFVARVPRAAFPASAGMRPRTWLPSQQTRRLVQGLVIRRDVVTDFGNNGVRYYLACRDSLLLGLKDGQRVQPGTRLEMEQGRPATGPTQAPVDRRSRDRRGPPRTARKSPGATQGRSRGSTQHPYQRSVANLLYLVERKRFRRRKRRLPPGVREWHRRS